MTLSLFLFPASLFASPFVCLYLCYLSLSLRVSECLSLSMLSLPLFLHQWMSVSIYAMSPSLSGTVNRRFSAFICSIYLSVCMSVSACLCLCPSVSVSAWVYTYVCLFLYLSFSLSLHQLSARVWTEVNIWILTHTSDWPRVQPPLVLFRTPSLQPFICKSAPT